MALARMEVEDTEGKVAESGIIVAIARRKGKRPFLKIRYYRRNGRGTLVQGQLLSSRHLSCPLTDITARNKQNYARGFLSWSRSFDFAKACNVSATS